MRAAVGGPQAAVSTRTPLAPSTARGRAHRPRQAGRSSVCAACSATDAGGEDAGAGASDAPGADVASEWKAFASSREEDMQVLRGSLDTDLIEGRRFDKGYQSACMRALRAIRKARARCRQRATRCSAIGSGADLPARAGAFLPSCAAGLCQMASAKRTCNARSSWRAVLARATRPPRASRRACQTAVPSTPCCFTTTSLPQNAGIARIPRTRRRRRRWLRARPSASRAWPVTAPSRAACCRCGTPSVLPRDSRRRRGRWRSAGSRRPLCWSRWACCSRLPPIGVARGRRTRRLRATEDSADSAARTRSFEHPLAPRASCAAVWLSLVSFTRAPCSCGPLA